MGGRNLDEIRAAFERMEEEQKEQTKIFEKMLSTLKDIKDLLRKD